MTAGWSPGSAFFWRRSSGWSSARHCGHEFVNYDDNMYVYENPEVTRGLTLEGIVWAFTHVRAANWHPLT